MCARPEGHPDTVRADAHVLPSSTLHTSNIRSNAAGHLLARIYKHSSRYQSVFLKTNIFWMKIILVCAQAQTARPRLPPAAGHILFLVKSCGIYGR
jgi:hypothetical protein